MNGTVVLKDLFNCAAIAYPVKMSAPKVFTELSDSVPAAGNFAGEEGVVMTFRFCAHTGAKSNRLEAGAGHELIERAGTTTGEKAKGVLSCSVIGGLH